MVTLTFDLDYEKMRVDGITEYDMLNPMREHSKQYEQQCVFSGEGENALCDIMIYVMKMASDSTEYVKYLRTCILTTAGGSEDCKQEMIRHYNKEGMKYIEFSK